MKTAQVLALVCVLTACGGSTESESFDGTDSAVVDTGTTTTPADSGTAPATDSEAPAADSGTASETGTPATDTGTPATDTGGGGGGGEAGKVNCGPTLKCTIPQVCCIGFAGGASYKCEAMCSGLSAAAKCDGPEDCSGGQRCCSGFPSGAQCKATCGTSEQDMCHTTSDCTGGKTCKECTTPGGGPAMKFCVAGGKCPF